MAKTGESYSAARAALLATGGRTGSADGAATSPAYREGPVLATSDAAIRERTGRGWEEWFDLLDGAGMDQRPHREIARWVADSLGIVPLAWAAQAVTVSYERARGGRAVGQRADGFAITVTRTVNAPADRLFTVFADPAERQRRLPGADLRERAATRPRSARFDWADDGTRVNVTIVAKGETRSTVTVEHARLANPDEGDRMKRWWRERLTTLASAMNAGGCDA
ncbi:hypothetical protein [Acrocarpospora catenulata]|uniref:hypothetical protein n=1 Tax=Acrocarpospora catenulata TaxID=2836182 RepID=UPI001BDB22B9|nr:hypothetical protein [Acrocarpospora catenulata]